MTEEVPIAGEDVTPTGSVVPVYLVAVDPIDDDFPHPFQIMQEQQADKNSKLSKLAKKLGLTEAELRLLVGG